MGGTDGVRETRKLKTHWEETLRLLWPHGPRVGNGNVERVLENDKQSLRRK